MAKMISHGSLVMRTIIFVWVAIFVVYSHTIIEGRHISREDYLEAKRLVKLSRRPSVKIIQVENGDIFDCVIIHKQLAFEHPALKNHTIRMKPTSIPEWKNDEGSNKTNLYIGLKGGGCPVGSIPVRRLQISDILRSTSVSSFGIPQRSIILFILQHASVQYDGEFSGAKAKMNLWNPDVGYNQFSLVQIWIINEPASPFKFMETIEAEWIVYPEEFDYKTRLFSYWTIDGHRNGCYNIGCGGFVQISERFEVGDEFPATSIYDGPQQYATLMTDRDSDGDWWLTVDGDRIGYWPKRIFNRLSRGKSTRVDWGGEVSTLLPRDRPWPQMGSGHFPEENNFLCKSSTISEMQVYQRRTGWQDAGAFGLAQSKPNCYTVIDGGNDYFWGRNIAFGGPGGEC